MKVIVQIAALSGVYADLISYRIQNAAQEMGALFINDGSFGTSLFSHGCWCAKLSEGASDNLGGYQPVDELDQICHDWARARRCSRQAGASCESADFTSMYETEVSPQACLDSDACLSETCQIDYHFISEINAWRSANSGTFSAVTNPVCPNHTTQQLNNCGDLVSTITTPSPEIEQVNEALDDAGVDNSNKQIAVSLTWERYCDLDLHVFEPNGVEIYYGRMSTANTGSLDADARRPGASGLAVENVSWLTAPSGYYRVAVKNWGSCSPGVPYKLYINIDGSTTVIDGVAPAGDNTKYQVTSFNWSSARSFNGNTEFGSDVIALPDQDPPKE